MKGESERCEIRRICLDRLSSKVVEVFCSVSEVESDGNSVDLFGVCLLRLLLCPL